MPGDSRLHRGSVIQRVVYSAIVVMGDVQGDARLQVLQLFREAERKPREPAPVDPAVSVEALRDTG